VSIPRTGGAQRAGGLEVALAPILKVFPTVWFGWSGYHELEQAVSAAAGRINGMYGEVAWTPVRYLNRAYSRSALAGIYRSAHVGLVTPLRDGMNLVAKEYVAAQDSDDPGVLILSRFAGAVECEEALLVNPYDADSVVSAIARALHMPLVERRERHGAMLARLARNGGTVWSTRFLQSLGRTQMEAGSLVETQSPVRSSRKVKPDTPLPDFASDTATSWPRG
jgi:trehalose 6-phosphate synthase